MRVMSRETERLLSLPWARLAVRRAHESKSGIIDLDSAKREWEHEQDLAEFDRCLKMK